MNIIEVSAHYMDWRECVRMAKANPNSQLLQFWAMKAQMKLVICQAQYFAEVRP